MRPEDVWGDVAAGQRSLWNARLFALGDVAEAWECALGIMGFSPTFSIDRWREADRLSLAESARLADSEALATARGRRMQNNWKLSAVALAETGTDVRPLLARAPGISVLADAGRTLRELACETKERGLTEAASRYYQVLLSQPDLDAGVVQRVVRDAGRQIESDHQLGQILLTVAREQPLNEAIRGAFLATFLNKYAALPMTMTGTLSADGATITWTAVTGTSTMTSTMNEEAPACLQKLTSTGSSS